jgi:phosphatidylglycerophosphate synthase
METITELRKICQQKEILSRSDESWYSKYFVRKFSIYLTRFFLIRGISANQVTYIGAFMFIIGTFLLATAIPSLVFLGAIFFQIFAILDSVDGEIARYHHKKSILGGYLEKMTHSIIIPLLFLSLSINSYIISKSSAFLFLGFSAVLAFLWASLVTEHKNSLYFEKGIMVSEIINKKEPSSKRVKMGRKVFGLASILVIILFLAILNLFFDNLDLGIIKIPLFGILVIFYGLFAHIPWIYYLIDNIHKDKISKDILYN